jgi:fructoselysine-6-P-deglycase FrlB-like protein
VIVSALSSRRVLAIEREIASQPAVWIDAAARAHELEQHLPPRGSRLAVVGCGTSYYVAQTVAALRERAGHGETDAFPASEFPERRYDAVLAVSRSGTTTEVVRVLERLRGRTPTVAVSAVPDLDVDRLADATVLLEFADEEAIVQTRFATAVVALVRALLGEDVAALAAAADEALAEPLAADPAAVDHVVFLGSGAAVGLANEAALKLREAAGAWTESYPAMEYRHGPVSATTPTTLVWALGAIEPGVLESAERAGASVVATGRDPLVELVAVHRFAVALAHARGLDPNEPRHLTRAVILS